MSPGEKRRRKAKREREHAAYVASLMPLRAAGKSCGDCANFQRVPLERDKHHCAMDSDFDGYAIVTRDHLCPSYKDRTP